MNKHSSNNFIIIFGVFISASLIRVVLNNHNYITKIIGSVNIIALWYVLYLILEYSEKKFLERIRNFDKVGEKLKIRKKKHFKIHLNIAKGIIFMLGLIYIFFLSNPIINDIISFGALFLSIETDYIYEFIQDFYFKKT